jgi:hypothetical protein
MSSMLTKQINIQAIPTVQLFVVTIPINALVDENGVPILDETGNFILVE